MKRGHKISLQDDLHINLASKTLGRGRTHRRPLPVSVLLLVPSDALIEVCVSLHKFEATLILALVQFGNIGGTEITNAETNCVYDSNAAGEDLSIFQP